jgi:hypothetical protein
MRSRTYVLMLGCARRVRFKTMMLMNEEQDDADAGVCPTGKIQNDDVDE